MINLKRPVKNVLFLTGFFIGIFFLTGCEQQQDNSNVFSGETMGTSYHIKISAEEIETEELKKEVDSLLGEVNKIFSTYDDLSEVSKFNNDDGRLEQERSSAFIKVLSESLRISNITSGAYDVTVGPLVNLWGFGSDFKENSIPDKESIDLALAQVGYEKIVLNLEKKLVKKLNAELYIDFSSIAKGYGVDQVSALIESKGFNNYMVEIGGEICVRGKNPGGNKWRIAVEKPEAAGRSIHRVINVTDTAIATSGNYRNFFEKKGVNFSHTINPKTGMPVQHKLASVTVLNTSSMTADAWATAFMVLGEEKGYDLALKNELAVLFLVQDGPELREVMTPEFKLITKEASL